MEGEESPTETTEKGNRVATSFAVIAESPCMKTATRSAGKTKLISETMTRRRISSQRRKGPPVKAKAPPHGEQRPEYQKVGEDRGHADNKKPNELDPHIPRPDPVKTAGSLPPTDHSVLRGTREGHW